MIIKETFLCIDLTIEYYYDIILDINNNRTICFQVFESFHSLNQLNTFRTNANVKVILIMIIIIFIPNCYIFISTWFFLVPEWFYFLPSFFFAIPLFVIPMPLYKKCIPEALLFFHYGFSTILSSYIIVKMKKMKNILITFFYRIHRHIYSYLEIKKWMSWFDNHFVPVFWIQKLSYFFLKEQKFLFLKFFFRDKINMKLDNNNL